MFRSATLKLTAWYVGIIMLISLGFSLAIFQISRSEVDSRLSRYQVLIHDQFPYFSDENNLRDDESARASLSLAIRLIYLNIGVLIIGTAASYILARRTLKPVEKAHEAEARFVSDASHELRTPLAIMKSELEMTLRDKNATKAELREILASNLEEVNNLTNMSETLLKMAKLEQKIPMSSVDIAALTSDVISRLKQPAKRISFHPTKAIKLTANSDLLQEVIMILIDNALKYSPASSTVVVQLKSSREAINLSVENQGKGINEHDLDHIFDRFYRADRSRTAHDDHKGLGLGLSLAKQIVELHNGYITVSSGHNQPTTFTISLPKHA